MVATVVRKRKRTKQPEPTETESPEQRAAGLGRLLALLRSMSESEIIDFIGGERPDGLEKLQSLCVKPDCRCPYEWEKYGCVCRAGINEDCSCPRAVKILKRCPHVGTQPAFDLSRDAMELLLWRLDEATYAEPAQATEFEWDMSKAALAKRYAKRFRRKQKVFFAADIVQQIKDPSLPIETRRQLASLSRQVVNGRNGQPIVGKLEAYDHDHGNRNRGSDDSAERPGEERPAASRGDCAAESTVDVGDGRGVVSDSEPAALSQAKPEWKAIHIRRLLF